MSTGTGSVGNDAGLAHVNAYVLDYKDGYADAVYGGDLLGNLWRFDITGTSGAYPSPLLFAQLTDGVGNPQPVTSRPIIEWHPKAKSRVVMVGTGRLLDASDRSSSLEQSFYAIKDGNDVRFNRATDLPAGITFPIGRAQLVRNDTLLADIAPTTASPMGWYVDLGLGADNVAWRLVNDPVPFAGTVAFAPTLPTVDDPCLPSGQSRIYGADFTTGKTVLTIDWNCRVVCAHHRRRHHRPAIPQRRRQAPPHLRHGYRRGQQPDGQLRLGAGYAPAQLARSGAGQLSLLGRALARMPALPVSKAIRVRHPDGAAVPA